MSLVAVTVEDDAAAAAATAAADALVTLLGDAVEATPATGVETAEAAATFGLEEVTGLGLQEYEYEYDFFPKIPKPTAITNRGLDKYSLRKELDLLLGGIIPLVNGLEVDLVILFTDTKGSGLLLGDLLVLLFSDSKNTSGVSGEDRSTGLIKIVSVSLLGVIPFPFSSFGFRHGFVQVCLRALHFSKLVLIRSAFTAA